MALVASSSLNVEDTLRNLRNRQSCGNLLWSAGIYVLGKVEQFDKSPRKEAQFVAQLPVAALLCNNPLVYACFLKAVVLLASLPVTKIGNENPPLSKLFPDGKQGQLRETRNQVEHTVSNVLFEADFPDKMDERTGASAAVMNAKGEFWWDGRYASLGLVWEIYEKTNKALDKARSRVPEQTRIQRGPDASDITSFKDWTNVSKKLWLGMNQSRTHPNWQAVVAKHCKPFALSGVSSLLPGVDDPPPFDNLLTAGQKGGTLAKTYTAWWELLAVQACLQASKGSNKPLWQPAYDSGNKDLAHCLQWILVKGGLLAFRETYTQGALSEQRDHGSSGRKSYEEDYLTKEENGMLNRMIRLADGYAHFHKDQVEVDQKDEYLIHVTDTPYTYIDDDVTEEMVKVAAKIRQHVHDQLWGLS